MLEKIPIYVYVIFVFLLFLGIYYTKDRKTTYQKTFIFPIVFGIFAIYGISNFGFSYHNIFFILGIFLGYIFGKILWKKKNFSCENGFIIIQGSIIPILYMMGIFLVKFIFGYLQARFPDISHNFYFLFSVNISYGIFFGIMLKRIEIIQEIYNNYKKGII
ncbi:hypothetical protein DLH72_03615 [Candidatus Gracilibacteria bacterium]|nr:MAG: hypothetical protein DLH72_03615 [Candidatus Gracilibacteria bacterium]